MPKPTDRRSSPPREREFVRKNIELRASVKGRFEEIAAEESSVFAQVTDLSLLREALARLLTHWWLHQHDRGTFTIQFPSQPENVIVNQFGIMSVSLNLLGLNNDNPDEKVRTNLTLPRSLLDELDKIATAQDKALTVLMRESFHLELLLYKLKEEGGVAFITLASEHKVDVVKGFGLSNPTPKRLMLLDGLDHDEELLSSPAKEPIQHAADEPVRESTQEAINESIEKQLE